jgi:hypothetical protein
MTHSRAGTLLLTGLVLIAGCHRRTPASPGSDEQRLISVSATPLKCPKFVLNPQDIQAEPTGNTVHLQGGHTITFAPGAVATLSRYSVERGSSWSGSNPQEYAEIKLTPLSGAPASFNAPVSIGVNYNPCPVEKDRRLRVFQSDAGWRPMGGADDRGGSYVITYVDHFSEYALAYP